jgi:small subunit ribosomal protein S16
MGKKKQPSYRIVVADSRMPRDGRYIESLGYYNPMSEPSTIELNDERALYWLGQGAQPSRQVQNLMKIKGVWERFQGPKANGDT